MVVSAFNSGFQFLILDDRRWNMESQYEVKLKTCNSFLHYSFFENVL